MIKRLKIKNFQSHKDTDLEFGNVNVIVGETDVGKTAILRALKKVVRDIPRGNDFVNVDATKCEIILHTDKGKVSRIVEVSRSETATRIVTNKYIVDDKDEYTGFKTDIPVEVQSIFDMPLIDLGGKSSIDLNFAGQLDVPFLISMSAGDRSRVFGALTGAGILDEAVSEVRKLRREESSRQGHLRDTITDLQKELDQLVDVEKYKQVLTKIGQTLETVRKREEQVASLNDYLQRLRTLAATGKKLKKRLVEFQFVEQVEKGLEGISRKVKTLSELRTLNGQLQQKASAVRDAEQSLKDLTRMLERKKEEFLVLVKRLGKCPLCGSTLTSQRIKELVKA